MQLSSKDIISIESNYALSNFLLVWQMTKWCNYNCSYCTQTRERLASQEQLVDRAKKINILAQQIKSSGKYLHLKLLGGEVTYYNLQEVLSNINLSNLSSIDLVTNFSRDNSYFIELFNYIKSRNSFTRFKVCASYHEEFGSLEDFVAKLRDLHLRSRDISLRLSLVVDGSCDVRYVKRLLLQNPYLHIYFSLLRDKDGCISVDLSPEWRGLINSRRAKSNSVTVTTAKRESFNLPMLHSIQSSLNLEPDFIGYYCSAGLTYLYVDCDGVVSRANCIQTKSADALLGNIDSGDIQLPKSLFRCALNPASTRRTCNLCSSVCIYKHHPEK